MKRSDFFSVSRYYLISLFKSKICTDSEISRKKQPKPIIKLVIATMNMMETIRDGFMSTTAPINKAAMTIETNKADAVHSVIDQCTQTARTVKIFSSRAWLGGSDSAVSVNTLNLSTRRPSLPVSTLKIAPIPVSKKTGATASCITWATVVRFSAAICMFLVI